MARTAISCQPPPRPAHHTASQRALAHPCPLTDLAHNWPLMCGLAGVISFDTRLGIESKVLGKMSSAIEHRGPDASGIWEVELESPHFSAGLVHCRLSILDPDSR